jgi:maleylpyruvate isomerase
MRPDDDIGGAADAHKRLLGTLAGLTDEMAAGPSLLPGWTVGHVLTHLARNADSLTGLCEAAQEDRVGVQYPGGPAQRTADIEAGAGRPATALGVDVADSAARLERAWAHTGNRAWDEGRAEMTTGVVPLGDVVFRRWRETEVHHADLGLDYTAADWPEAYVTAELARLVEVVAGRLAAGVAVRMVATDTGTVWTAGSGEAMEVAGARHTLVAWLLGRHHDPAWPVLGPW